MDYENFKERFVEDLKDKLYEKGIEADVSVNTVNKLNDSYEAVTIKPVDDQIGVNISINKCFEAYEHGTDYNTTVDKTAQLVADSLENKPEVDLDTLSDYDKMKDKLVMEVVSAETNKDRIEQATKSPIYFCRENKNDRLGTYIKASDRDMARALAQKGYAETVQKNLNKQINLIEDLLKSYDTLDLKTYHTKYNKARRALISSYELSDEEYVQKWYEETSAKIAYYQALKQQDSENTSESKTFTTANGEIVKSKSEVIIADTLLRLGIPYQYELPFEQNGRVVFRPDFTVLNVNSRKQVYIEHFGRMDDEEYRKSFFWKMSNFSKMGIIQGNNLIMTFEDYDNSFDIADYIKDFEFMCMS